MPQQSSGSLNNSMLGMKTTSNQPSTEDSVRPDPTVIMDYTLSNGIAPSMDYSLAGALDLDHSVIAAAGGDITMMNGTAPNITLATTNLAQLGLLYEARLLEKDR